MTTLRYTHLRIITPGPLPKGPIFARCVSRNLFVNPLNRKGITYSIPKHKLYTYSSNTMKDDAAHKETARQAASETPDTAWSKEAPYLRPENCGDGFEKKILGSCHCETVQYWLSREKPLATKFCHCSDCKIIHGAPFQWAAIFHKKDIAFIKGTDNLQFLNSGTDHPRHELPCKVRCRSCGSLIMDEGRNMILLFPTLLRMDPEKLYKDFYPQMHIFYGSRVVDIPDGKPKWKGINDDSERMDLP